MFMTRCFVLTLFLSLTGILLMGCAHDFSSERSYLLRGENEEWMVDLQMILGDQLSSITIQI